ncbi:protamine-2 protein, partial [Trichinella spiralis]|uniref:protamine-2 protein n=1 Tax=Trichinella spiralis TaxID=6334 RepID=UPI0001EFE40C
MYVVKGKKVRQQKVMLDSRCPRRLHCSGDQVHQSGSVGRYYGKRRGENCQKRRNPRDESSEIRQNRRHVQFDIFKRCQRFAQSSATLLFHANLCKQNCLERL